MELSKNINTRLEKRFSKLCKANYVDAGNELRIFYNYMVSNQFINSILERINSKADEYLNIINSSQGIVFNPQNEFEKQYMSYGLIKKCVADTRNYPQWEIVKNLNRRINHLNTDQSTEYFHSQYVQTIVEYIKESIEDSNLILTILLKYKQKCEWFRRKDLAKLIEDNTKIAERLLASNLFEYFFDNGIQLNIEPKSASGRPDFISTQIAGNKLIADAKIFNPASGKNVTYIAKGFNQIYHYLQDYNDSLGYLVIFKTCEEDLHLSLDNTTTKIPYLIYNSKIIYVITIDIHLYEKSASKRGKINCHAMEKEFIIRTILDN